MPSNTLTLGDLEEYTANPAEVRAGTVEPTYFRFKFHRDDIGTVEHEGYAEEVAPVNTADLREVRTLEDEEWRYFATVHVRESTGSDVRFLFENEEGEMYDGIVETGEGVEMLHPVTVIELSD
jgi:hypothetical protein